MVKVPPVLDIHIVSDQAWSTAYTSLEILYEESVLQNPKCTNCTVQKQLYVGSGQYAWQGKVREYLQNVHETTGRQMKEHY